MALTSSNRASSNYKVKWKTQPNSFTKGRRQRLFTSLLTQLASFFPGFIALNCDCIFIKVLIVGFLHLEIFLVFWNVCERRGRWSRRILVAWNSHNKSITEIYIGRIVNMVDHIWCRLKRDYHTTTPSKLLYSLFLNLCDCPGILLVFTLFRSTRSGILKSLKDLFFE